MTLDEILARYPGAATFRFGDSETLSRELLDLVRSGKKTATCSDLREIERGNEAMPKAGRRDVALNWDGTAALAIETISTNVCTFEQVDEEFALAEGENATFEGWRRDHKAYYEKNGGFSPDMLLVCERFRVVEDFAN